MKQTQDTSRFIIDIVSAGLLGDKNRVEAIAISLARSLKKENPELSNNLFNQLSTNTSAGAAGLRGVAGNPIPIDADTHLEMAQVFPPNDRLDISPIFNENLSDQIASILNEWDKVKVLLENGIKPTNSLLLIGQPGTGKTMLARDIANKLGKNLVILDLSTTISNLLGKTGHNIKKILNYAKNTNSVLLLDEFDAIAKKRDDNSDLGEIKRVVNVLLMELEDWPVTSMLVATSNHPELLDRAIWRRFDQTIEIPLPSVKEISAILSKHLILSFAKGPIEKKLSSIISELLLGKNAAEIVKISDRVKKRILLNSEEMVPAFLNELDINSPDKKIKGKFCLLLKESYGDKMSIRKISTLTGLSASGVQHHLNKSKL